MRTPRTVYPYLQSKFSNSNCDLRGGPQGSLKDEDAHHPLLQRYNNERIAVWRHLFNATIMTVPSLRFLQRRSSFKAADDRRFYCFRDRNCGPPSDTLEDGNLLAKPDDLNFRFARTNDRNARLS